MNKLILLLALSALVNTSQTLAEENSSTFSGPYMSVGAGYQHNLIDNENVRATTGSPSFNQPSASNHDIFGQIQAGYGRDFFEKYNISVGLFYDFGGSKVNDIKATFYQDIVKQRLENTAGIFIAPGYYINKETLVFVKAGYVHADKEYVRFKQTPNININLDDSVDGYLWGVGVKHMVSKNIFVGADLTKFSYGTSSSIASLNGLEVKVSSKAEQTNALLSVGYMF